MAALAVQLQADTLYWKPTANGNLDGADVWKDGSGGDATFTTGDDLVIDGAYAHSLNGVMNLGDGNITFTTTNRDGELNGNGRLQGSGDMIINIDGNRFSLRTANLLTDFTGDIYVNTSNNSIFRLGSNSDNNQNFGSGTIIMNGGLLRVEVSDTETATILTTIRLTNGATIAAHARNNVNVTNLEIGDGTTDETITYTGRGGGNETGTGSGSTILNIYGELSGSAGSTFILNGTRPSGDYTSTVKLHSANSYEGTLRVVGKNDTGGNTLALLHEGAAQYATVDLQGGTPGTEARNAQARLSIGVASAKVAGLTGTDNSLVTSTVANSTLTVNNSKDNTYNGKIDDGVGGFALVKTGTGTLTLGTANTYAGGTTITEGTLVAANAAALGTGNVRINGGTLQTTVSNLQLNGSLTMTSGNIIFGSSVPSSGGTGTPVMTLTDMMASGGAFTLNMNADGGYQSIVSSTGGMGILSLTNGFVLTIDMSAYTGATESTVININDFFEGFGSISIDYANVIRLVDPTGLTGWVDAKSGKIRFDTPPVIPEPSTAALFALAACGLIGRRNRKAVA